MRTTKFKPKTANPWQTPAAQAMSNKQQESHPQLCLIIKTTLLTTLVFQIIASASQHACGQPMKGRPMRPRQQQQHASPIVRRAANQEAPFANRAAPADSSATHKNAPTVEETTTTTTTTTTRTSNVKNVTAQNGQSVLLHCLVEPSSGDALNEPRAVSWFRGTGELQLLTYESTTIIQDERFVVRHGFADHHDWALQIKNLDKTTDSGLYQCQTNSDPPQSQLYQLNVVEPQVHILGAPELAVRVGAPINLTCVISPTPEQPQYIFWYRDHRMINYDLDEQRAKILLSKWAHKPDTFTSSLLVYQSKLTDSANYTCMPSGARPVSVHVHVLEGSDRRLIMFQRQANYDPTAQSSQLTNSAISVHVVRLSRGRAYALFLAFLIFAAWFQLVSQAQTAISLLLLAVIGFFLGRSPPASPSRWPSPELAASALAKQRGLLEQQVEPSVNEEKTKRDEERANNKKRRRRRHANKRTKEGAAELLVPSSASASSSPSSNESATSKKRASASCSPSQASTVEPRADPLDMLKELSSEVSCEEADEDSFQNLAAGSKLTRRGATPRSAPTQATPLSSPSASSSNSTGYNSAEYAAIGQQQQQQQQALRQPCFRLTPSVAAGGQTTADCVLLVAARPHKEEEEEEEMIELVRQPTALRLIMDEFGAKPKGLQQEAAQSPVTALITSTGTVQLGQAPLKPAREQRQLERRRWPPDTGKASAASLDPEEPHYSSPAAPFGGSGGHQLLLAERQHLQRSTNEQGQHSPTSAASFS